MKRLAFLLFAFYFAPHCLAQTGYPLYSSFQNGPVDSVNLQNLNQVVSLPGIQSAGRGGSGFAFSPTYNSLVWVPSGGTWQPLSTGSWITSPPLGSVTSSFTGSSGTCGICRGDNCPGYTTQSEWYGYVYVDPAGAPHSFSVRVTDTYSSCTNRDLITGSWTGYSSDNLYYISIGTPGNDPSTAIVTSAKTGVKMNGPAG